MKAAVNKRYGSPHAVLSVQEVETPKISANEILVAVRASGVNRTDDGFLRAKPFITRFFSGLTKPRHPTLGCEFAGEVVEIGTDVQRFAVGDRVFGFDDIWWGGHAQYKVMSEGASVATLPESISFKHGGVATEGGNYALQDIRVIQKQGVQSVFIHGATGAIGTAAVQLLKQAGMRVVATSTTKNMQLVKSLGADDVIDWETQDFTAYEEQFDCVFDSVGKSSFKACKPLLKKGGIYISTELGPGAQNPLFALVSPLFKIVGAKRILFPLPKNSPESAEFLRDRLEDGSYLPVIDRSYALDDIVDAYTYVETEQKTGNVSIEISKSPVLK